MRASSALVAVMVAGAAAAFLLLDIVLAAALVAVAGTLVAMAVIGRDWDQHPTFEQRERVRARRRAVKHEKGADARARDRARWEAYQARKAQKEAQSRTRD